MIDTTMETPAAMARKHACRHLPQTVRLNNGTVLTLRLLGMDDGEKLAAFYASIPPQDQFFYYPHPLDAQHAHENAASSAGPGYCCLLLEYPEGAIAGYAWYRWKAGDRASGFGICIRQDFQSRGAGTILMKHLLAIARTYGPPIMSLTVQKANPRAVTLYQSMGFEIVREELRYSDQEPQYYMERSCNGSCLVMD